MEIEHFIQWVRVRSPQARTWRDYQCDLALFKHKMGERSVETIRPRDMDAYMHLLVEAGFKPSTVNRRLAAVTSLYTYLIESGWQISNPVIPRRHYVKEPQRLPRPVNEQELRKFFAAIRDVRDRAMFTLMLRCGLRIAEVAALVLSDLYLGDAPARIILQGKGAHERTVYVSPEAGRDLQLWLAVRPKTKCENVFVSYQKKKLSTTSINVRVKHVCAASGVSLTAHRLRHTFADNLLSAGMPITSIQKLMGHRFVETTQNYAMANDRQVEADFYAACKKIEGWHMLLGAEQVKVWGEAGINSLIAASTAAATADPGSISFDLPEAYASRIPAQMLPHLEAYRQLKANRWRPERVVENSLHFYSKHAQMWDFFTQNCNVHGVEELRFEHVAQFIQDGVKRGRSPSTVNGSLSLLRCFLMYVKEDSLVIDPSLENIKRLKGVEHLPRHISHEQVKRIRDEMEADLAGNREESQVYDTLLLRAIFHLLWQGGLRVGEVEALRFSDFFISTANQARRLFVRDGKWRKGRAVYLTDMQLDTLQAYLAARGNEHLDGFVFVRNHAPLRRGFVAQRLRSLGARVNVTISPHRLRHTFATQLLNVGCQVTSIQKLLGHTNLNTTMTYARAFDQTVMLDYLNAINTIEIQPGGAWHEIDIPVG